VIPETAITPTRAEGFFKLDESVVSSNPDEDSAPGTVVCDEGKHLIESIQAGGAHKPMKARNLNILLDFDKLKISE